MSHSIFNRWNTNFAYQLHYHLGFQTHYSAKVLASQDRSEALAQLFGETCQRNDFHILESQIEDNWLRSIVSLRPSHAPAAVVRTLKANTSRWMFEKFQSLESDIGRRSLWAQGYYLRGIGEVTNKTVLEYVAHQREHHELELRNSKELVNYQHPSPDKFLDLRPYSHCVAEYNCHLVCCPSNRAPVFDERIGEALLQCVRGITRDRGIELISAAIMEDHMHLFAALSPSNSPEDFAFWVMNGTAEWMMRHNPGALKAWDAPGLWTPSAFIRTAGAATTNMVREYLSRLGGQQASPYCSSGAGSGGAR